MSVTRGRAFSKAGNIKPRHEDEMETKKYIKKNQSKVRMWGCILSSSYHRGSVWLFVMAGKRRKGQKKRKKKEKISSHPQMAARSSANVKRRRATAGAPAKEERTVAEHGGFADGYMSREMMESPSQMSQYHLISWDKTICVQRAAARPHLFRFCFLFHR